MLILIHDGRKIVRFDVTQHPSLAGKAEGTMKMSADEKYSKKLGICNYVQAEMQRDSGAQNG
jgi:hypothetical protein